MTVSLQKIVDGKRALRRELSALPIAEKLRMLEQMREREFAIRAGQTASGDESAQGSWLRHARS